MISLGRLCGRRVTVRARYLGKPWNKNSGSDVYMYNLHVSWPERVVLAIANRNRTMIALLAQRRTCMYMYLNMCTCACRCTRTCTHAGYTCWLAGTTQHALWPLQRQEVWGTSGRQAASESLGDEIRWRFLLCCIAGVWEIIILPIMKALVPA